MAETGSAHENAVLVSLSYIRAAFWGLAGVILVATAAVVTAAQPQGQISQIICYPSGITLPTYSCTTTYVPPGSQVNSAAIFLIGLALLIVAAYRSNQVYKTEQKLVLGTAVLPLAAAVGNLPSSVVKPSSPPVNRPFCAGCGKELAGDETFCPRCGRKATSA